MRATVQASSSCVPAEASACMKDRMTSVNGKAGSHFDTSIKALANEDTLLPTQMFPRLPARATFVADTNFVPGHKKCL